MLRKQSKTSRDAFKANFDSLGCVFAASDDAVRSIRSGEMAGDLFTQFTYLSMLAERGIAEEVAPNQRFAVATDELPRLDNNIRKTLGLPLPWRGSFRLSFRGTTQSPDFEARVVLVDTDGSEISHWSLKGALVDLGDDEVYLPDEAQFTLLRAVCDHAKDAPGRHTETDNVQLIYACQAAQKHGADVSLAQFDALDVMQPETVGLTVYRLPSGALSLSPNLGGELDPDAVRERLGQLTGSADKGVMRVGDKIVLLNEEQHKALNEIVQNRHIAPKDVDKFLENPAAFIDASLVSLDIGFSMRVNGIVPFHHSYFGEPETVRQNWMDGAKRPCLSPTEALRRTETIEELEAFESTAKQAIASGAGLMAQEDFDVNISDPETVFSAIDGTRSAIQQGNREAAPKPKPAAKEAEEALTFGLKENNENPDFGEPQYGDLYDGFLDFGNLADDRHPFPHQEHGIKWLLGYALKAASGASGFRGVLLADDMGLGKTFQTLVALEQYFRLKEARGEMCKPALVVAPLILLENWKAEVQRTFKETPFRDIVLLQDKGLTPFKHIGVKRETHQTLRPEDARIDDPDATVSDGLRYSLKIGSAAGGSRLDVPKRLVLTTYETLRNYQFSLASIDWSFVVFDESQRIKDPNTLQTRAAKAVKREFGIAVTGTPVENSLKDIWCIVDTIAPNHLGSFREFGKKYIRPINQADDQSRDQVRTEIGKMLRFDIGSIMLRRSKAGELKGLPKKTTLTGAEEPRPGQVHAKELAAVMTGRQLSAYDHVMDEAQHAKATGKQTAILGALEKWRGISVHPDYVTSEIPRFSSSKEATEWCQESAKLRNVLQILRSIRSKREKALLFLINDRLQAMVSNALARALGLPPIPVINGATPTRETATNVQTRRRMIEEFEAREGFGLLILSPIAAGQGLTILAPNHVIHLQRHWNPAKEDQATDRVYRIGQTRDVTVYLPIARHPQRMSFDENLNGLLGTKIDLQDAVVTTEDIDRDTLFSQTAG